MSNTPSDLLAPAWMNLDLHAKNGPEAIRNVAGLLSTNPGVDDAASFVTEVLEREKLSTTAVGHGVAFPHARSRHVREVVMAVGRSVAGIHFDTAAEDVHFIFVIGTPPEMVPQYLALVGKLVRLVKTAEVRERLMTAASPEDFLKALR